MSGSFKTISNQRGLYFVNDRLGSWVGGLSGCEPDGQGFDHHRKGHNFSGITVTRACTLLSAHLSTTSTVYIV